MNGLQSRRLVRRAMSGRAGSFLCQSDLRSSVKRERRTVDELIGRAAALVGQRCSCRTNRG